MATTQLPPGPRQPSLLQTVRYTFDQPGFFAECRERYGPTFTIRLPGFPPAVITRDRDAIRRMFTGDPLAKRHGNDVLRPFIGDRSLLLLEPSEHLARRKLELPSFHGDSIRAYTERIRELAETEVASWTAGEVVAVHPRTRQLTLTVILELVLGVRDAQLTQRLAALFDMLDSRATNLAQFLPDWVKRRSAWNIPGRLAHDRLDMLNALLTEHVARVRADPGLETRDDVLSLLVRARAEDGATLTDIDLRDELLTLVAAGHETTATAMAWAADLLAHHPAVAAQLRETLADGDRTYLRATAKEVLRARSVLYLSAGRHSLDGIQVGEWFVGPDAVVLVDAQGLHGDPELFPEPEAFRPERFLGDQPDGYSYVPFGGGAHRCLGAALATMELELMIEAIAGGADLAPAGPPARPVRRGITLAPAGGAKVRVLQVQGARKNVQFAAHE